MSANRPGTPKVIGEPSRTLRVELIWLDDALIGPAMAIVDVFRLINHLAGLRGARRPRVLWRWRGADGRSRRGGPGACDESMAAWGDGAVDLYVVPGWLARHGPHLDQLVRRDAAACRRLVDAHRDGAHLLALYTGVALLGEAGLLGGRRVVVPWPFLQSVLRHAAGVTVESGAAWIRDDRIWTGDSPTLPTELIFEILRALGLRELADSAAQVWLHAEQRQRLADGMMRAGNSRLGPGSIERARRWLDEHAHEPYAI